MAAAATTSKEAVLAGLLRVGDALLAGLSGYLAYLLRFGDLSPPTFYLAAIFLAPLVAFNALALSGVYRSDRVRRPLRRFGRTLFSWLAAAAVLALLSVILKITDFYSRFWFLLWIFLGCVGLFVLRLAVATLVAHWRGTGEALMRVVIVGTGERARAVARQLAGTESAVLGVVGHVWTDAVAPRAPERRLGPVPASVGATAVAAAGETMSLVAETRREILLGGVERLAEIVREERVDEAIVAVEPGDRDALARVVQALKRLPIAVRFAMTPPAVDLPTRGVSELGGLPMLDIWRPPLTAWERLLKAAEDRVLAAIFLVLAAPLLLLIAACIKLDSPGPVFFRQRRAGFSNDAFEMLKFRTMVHDGATEGDGEEAAELPQAQRNDRRVTRVGAFLRRSSLDELPQLVNVLRGEMSLVGPRPHAIQHDRLYARLLDDYLGRQRVRPGMTGWAQVNGLRGETESPEKMRRRVLYDLHYIDNWSVWFDLKILFLTLFVGFVNKNAY